MKTSSYVVPEIFLRLGSSSRCPDFQISTFISGCPKCYILSRLKVFAYAFGISRVWGPFRSHKLKFEWIISPFRSSEILVNTQCKGSAAFCSKLPKLFLLLGHDMRLKMVQMSHITSFLTLAHKFVVVFDFENMLWRYAFSPNLK